jgi:hypothetical protein
MTATAIAPAIEVGDLQPAEAELLFGLAKSAFETNLGWTDARVVAALADDVVFVAREDGVQAGYVALAANADEGLVIEQLLVAPGHERRALGDRVPVDHRRGRQSRRSRLLPALRFRSCRARVVRARVASTRLTADRSAILAV